MSTNNLQDKFKATRFKGVENFLRRIAFNLGNSPSQTEVKIISCIPIDVTDLQQKIIHLEKQLDEARARCPAPSSESCPPRPITQVCERVGPDLPNPVHRPYPSGPAHGPYPPDPPTPHTDRLYPQRDSSAASTHVPQTHSPSTHPCICYSIDLSDTEDNNKSKGIFKRIKRKKAKNKDKQKTKFVYYAQTTTAGPFSGYMDARRPEKAPTRRRDTPSCTYISDVIRKQYAPVLIGRERSVSVFSSPVCRDAETSALAAGPCASDVCSCCRGAFHDLDQHMATHEYTDVLNTAPAYSYKEYVNVASFYDSSLYDMIPVRDEPARTVATCYETSKIKVPRNTANATYHPQRIRSKTRYQPINRAPKPAPMLYTKKEKPVRIASPPSRRVKRVERIKRADTLNSCSVDCGSVYMKRINGNRKVTEPTPPMQPSKSATHKNAECLTNSLNDTECQTTTTQSVQIDQQLLEEKKTEETLNQIKTILQSVLTEVKTNTQLKNTSEIKEKVTRDAVVQKGTSQGNMPPGCSSLLHSFTYSPYNMDPYIASCSRQMNSVPYCFQNLPYPSAKCMQNFPVFIHTPGRLGCAGCYRNSSHIPKVPQQKPAATTATNTDAGQQQERSKETETLIKEIYKSMANAAFPTKDTSVSECNDLKSTPRVSVNKSLYRRSVLDEGMRQFVKANASGSLQQSATPTTTRASKLMSNTLSLRSQVLTSTTDTERNLRNHRIDSYLENVAAHRKRQSKIVEELEYEQSPATTASDEEDASFSEASVRQIYAPLKEKEPAKKSDKEGLFSKMLKSVKLFHGKSNNKKQEEPVVVEIDAEEESGEDSDDYQTIYSQRVDRRPRYAPRAVRSPHRLKAFSKISYSRQMRDRNQERPKRSPYMEQEHRRCWNERLMCKENQRRYSSDSRDSKGTPYRRPRHPRDPYWRNYEARSALINDNRVLDSRFANPSERPNFTREDIIRAVDKDPGAPKANAAKKGLAWLKKHKINCACGEQWKKFILEG